MTYDGPHEILTTRCGPVEWVELRYRPDADGMTPALHPGLHEAIYDLLENWPVR